MNMNVLIVDDEFLSRNNIKCIIDWKKYGFTIVGETKNGIEALEFIRNNTVDLVITDIYMPVMDGIELCQHLHREFPQIQIIVLSAYQDYQNIRETFKSGATDYMLKHSLTESTLSSVLFEIKQHTFNGDVYPGSNCKSDSIHLLGNYTKQQLIKDLILGKKSLEEVSSFFALIGDNNLSGPFIVALIEIKNFKYLPDEHSDNDVRSVLEHVVNISTKVFQHNNTENILTLGNGKFAILYPYNTQRNNAVLLIETYLLRIVDNINSYLCIQINFGIGSPENSFDPHACYISACKDLEIRKYNQKKSETVPNNFSLSLKHENELVSALCNFNKSKTFQWLDEIFEQSSSNFLSLRMIFSEIISIASKFSLENDTNITDVLNEVNLDLDTIKKIRTKSEAAQYAKLILGCLIERTDEFSTYKQCSDKVRLVIKYINENYSKNLTLRDIAKSIGFTPNWLCESIKKETGKNISTFINQIRISNAKKMIKAGENNLPLIANMVGFNYYSYFSLIFKKETGKTPLEYLREFEKENSKRAWKAKRFIN